MIPNSSYVQPFPRIKSNFPSPASYCYNIVTKFISPSTNFYHYLNLSICCVAKQWKIHWKGSFKKACSKEPCFPNFKLSNLLQWCLGRDPENSLDFSLSDATPTFPGKNIYTDVRNEGIGLKNKNQTRFHFPIAMFSMKAIPFYQLCLFGWATSSGEWQDTNMGRRNQCHAV